MRESLQAGALWFPFLQTPGGSYYQPRESTEPFGGISQRLRPGQARGEGMKLPALALTHWLGPGFELLIWATGLMGLTELYALWGPS